MKTTLRPIKRNRKKLLIIIISVTVLIVLAFFTGRYLIFREIRNNLTERLAALRRDGTDIRFENANFNLWSGKIEFYQLHVVITDSTLEQVNANIPYLLIKGVDIIPFITSKVLSVGSVSIEKPTVTYNQHADLVQGKSNSKASLENIAIKTISISEVLFHLRDTLGLDTIANIYGNVNITNMGVERQRDSLVWKDADVALFNIQCEMPLDDYRFSIKRASLKLPDKTFRLDSLRITPTMTRKAFMRKYGKQIDYLSGVVPSISITGINVSASPKLAVNLNKIELQFKLDIYRDKRYPFRKDTYSTLPSHFLHRLPVSVFIDTIRVKESHISYEEFPEAGDSSGRIFFERVHATITSVNNRKDDPRDVHMKAYAKFMGSGDLLATFTFPSDTTKPYRASGTLKKMKLASLNGMLVPHVKARIESGVMTNMKFHFAYNLVRSDGEVELNYEDLRILSLRRDKNDQEAVSTIKTLLLNTFIIKKNMNDEMRDDQKTGTILFYRDTKRSIFNYWWKSLLSGIKSAYKLDRLPARTEKAERKKLFGKKKDSEQAKL